MSQFAVFVNFVKKPKYFLSAVALNEYQYKYHIYVGSTLNKFQIKQRAVIILISVLQKIFKALEKLLADHVNVKG